MPSAIVVGTNSWCTLAEATAYFSTRIGTSAWDALTTDAEKEKYLITAYNWIRYDSAFSVTGSETIAAIKYGQCEGALFLVSYSADYARRDALISSGVTEFTLSKWSETLGEVKKPQFVINFFSNAGVYNGGIGIVQLVDDSDDY